MTKEKVAKGSLPPSIVTDLDDLVGMVAAGPINTKQFITEPAFVSAEDGTGGRVRDRHQAAEDLVAVTVTVDADRGVANQIAPGDHVNIADNGDGVDGAERESEYILDNVKVLAVGASTAAQQAATAAPTDDRGRRRLHRRTRVCSPSR